MKEAETRERLPPGQVLTHKWPVLTYGETPRADLQTWAFRCFGLVDQELSWTWKEFLDLPRVECFEDGQILAHDLRQALGIQAERRGLRAIVTHATRDFRGGLPAIVDTALVR